VSTDLDLQKRQVRSGCQTVGGCLALVVAVIIVAEGAPTLVRHLAAIPEGKDVIVFVRPRSVANQMIYVPLFALACMFAAAAFAKTARRAIIGVALVLLAFVGIGDWLWYQTFAAIDLRSETIRLIYLWPRPDIPLDARDVQSVGEIRSGEPAGGGGSDFTFRLQLATSSGHYVSMAQRAEGQVAAAKERLRQLNPRIEVKDAPLW
jgi:hypothetical protein